MLDSNFVGDPQFVNAAAYDFHLKAGSPALEKGVAPGTGAGQSLAALCQYVHPAHAVVRTTVGTIDQGGFELGGETTTPCGGTLPGDAGPIDGGVTTDAAAPGDDATPAIDAATAGDAGATDVPTSDEAGCGCRTTGRSPGSALGLGLAFFALASRRRR